MIVAVIEIGSGTTRLQVAEIYDDGSIRPKRVPDPNNYKIDLAMALGSGQARILTRLQELEGCIRTLKQKAESAGAKLIGCFGTEAVRQISQNKLFDFDRLGSRLGLPIHVLPSGGEAKLTFWAAAKEPRLGVKSGEHLTVIDLGNASTDIAVGSLSSGVPVISATVGLNKGRRILIKDFRGIGQDLEACYAMVRAFLKDAELPRSRKNSRIIFAGGVATKHAWLNVRKDEFETYDKDPKRVDGITLSIEELDARARQVLDMARENSESARKFVDHRSPQSNYDEVDAIISGGVFAACLLASLGKAECTVTSQTARFGALYMMAHERSNQLL